MLGLIDKAFRDRRREHIPLVYAAIYSLFFLAIIALIVVPFICIRNDAPMTSWPKVYLTNAIIFVPIALTSCAMAMLFGWLKYSRLSVIVAATIFGMTMPIAIIGTLSIPASFLHGNFFRGVSTQEGIENAVFLFLLFGFLGAAIYVTSFCRKDGDS